MILNWDQQKVQVFPEEKASLKQGVLTIRNQKRTLPQRPILRITLRHFPECLEDTDTFEVLLIQQQRRNFTQNSLCTAAEKVQAHKFTLL